MIPEMDSRCHHKNTTIPLSGPDTSLTARDTTLAIRNH